MLTATREPFVQGRPLVVFREINLDDAKGKRRTFKPGAPFDPSLVTEREARQLYDAHYLNHAGAETAEVKPSKAKKKDKAGDGGSA